MAVVIAPLVIALLVAIPAVAIRPRLFWLAVRGTVLFVVLFVAYVIASCL